MSAVIDDLVRGVAGRKPLSMNLSLSRPECTHNRRAGLRAMAPRSALSTSPSAESKKCFVLMVGFCGEEEIRRKVAEVIEQREGEI